jgi:hypothetical protein
MSDQRFRSRKFMLAMLSFVMSSAWLALGMIDALQWVDITKWVLGLYLAGNVGDTAAERLARP